MKNKMNYIGIIILLIIFSLFYLISFYFLEKKQDDKNITVDNTESINNNVTNNYDKEVAIVSNLYNDVRILYDVINSKFKVDQDDVIIIDEITYKKITNFDEVVYSVFTDNGLNKYISDLKSYFAYKDGEYYLAGNLVSYQTYYFRGDNTDIFVLNSTDDEIEALIHEKWSSNNKVTLATIKVVNNNGKYLIDNVDILLNE